MALFSRYGIVNELYAVKDKGYTRLTISTNIPFKTKKLKFNVWDTILLRKEDTMERFKLGDEVEIQYSYRNDYPQLIGLMSMSIFFEI